MTDEEQTIEIKLLRRDVDRLQSDQESEKGTRSRANVALHERLDTIDQNQRKQERILYMGLGGLYVLQFLITLAK